MSIRPFSLSATLLAAALSVATIQPVKADDGQTPVAPADAQASKPADAPAEGAPREGGPREGGPRRGGGAGGPGEGGPRRGGGEGGGRGAGGGGRRGGIDPNETPEQRQARRERSIEWYVHVIPNVTDAQKQHLMVIVESHANDLRAVRGATDLTPERRRENSAKVYDQLPDRIKAALTVEQAEVYGDIIAQQKQNAIDTANIGSARPGEALEDLRARVLVGYESFMEELSVKQKTQIIKALEAAGEESAAVSADTKLSADQKKQALVKIHEGVSAKVAPLLDADQKKSWDKVHATKKP